MIEVGSFIPPLNTFSFAQAQEKVTCKLIYYITGKLKIIFSCNFIKEIMSNQDYVITTKHQTILRCNLKKRVIGKLVYQITSKPEIMVNCNFKKKIMSNQFHRFIDKYKKILSGNLKNEIIYNRANQVTGGRINWKNRNIYYRFAYILGYL